MTDRQATDWFAWFVSAAFFAVIALLALWGLAPSGSEAVLILVGQASGAFGAIISYRYGTTAGSEKKSEQITQLAQTAAVSASTAAAVQVAASAPPHTVPDPEGVTTVPPIVVESVTIKDGTEQEPPQEVQK